MANLGTSLKGSFYFPVRFFVKRKERGGHGSEIVHSLANLVWSRLVS